MNYSSLALPNPVLSPNAPERVVRFLAYLLEIDNELRGDSADLSAASL